MTEPIDAEPEGSDQASPDVEARRRQAANLFNRTWQLLETPQRSAEQDREMLCCACASRLLWQDVGNEENVAVGDWMVAHVASRLGYGPLALDFAVAALDRARGADLDPWVHASALEGVARAHAVAGDPQRRDEYVALARQALELVDDADDRAVVESQLATVPEA